MYYIQFSQASLSITNSQSLLKLVSIESVMPSSHLILCTILGWCKIIAFFALLNFAISYWNMFIFLEEDMASHSSTLA